MLSEEAMMLYFFDVERNVAITNSPTSEQPTGDDYIVKWGQRRRISDTNIINKAKFIMKKLIPGIDFSDYLENLAAPTNMIEGKSWNDNLNINKKSRSKKSKNTIVQEPETYIRYR